MKVRDNEVEMINLQLYEMLKVYTKMQQDVDVFGLKNHSSYWLVISTLLETQNIEDLDQ